jgi:hypothetical protein
VDLGLIATRICIGISFQLFDMMTFPDLTPSKVNQEPDIAVNIITAVCSRINSVQAAHFEIDPMVNHGLLTTFYLLRVRLVSRVFESSSHVTTRTDILFQAWLQGLPDTVDHCWAKVPEPIAMRHRQMIFETCFVMGDQALAQRQPDVALTWLQRASDHLQELGLDPETAFPSFNEWDLVVRHSLGKWLKMVEDLD